jgi:hypothetical protein
MKLRFAVRFFALLVLVCPVHAFALWTPNGVPLSTAVNVQQWPAITTDGAAGAIVAWYDKRNGTNFDILASRFTRAGGWEAPVPLEQADGNAFQVPGNLAAYGDAFTVVWKQMVGSEFNAYRSTYSPADDVFSEASLLNTGSTNVWFGAPVIFGCALRQPSGKYRLSLERVEAERTGDTDADVDRIVAAYTATLERWVRRAPEQYFWHHRRWKHQRPGTPPELGDPS